MEDEGRNGNITCILTHIWNPEAKKRPGNEFVPTLVSSRFCRNESVVSHYSKFVTGNGKIV